MLSKKPINMILGINLWQKKVCCKGFALSHYQKIVSFVLNRLGANFQDFSTFQPFCSLLTKLNKKKPTSGPFWAFLGRFGPLYAVLTISIKLTKPAYHVCSMLF